MFYTNRKRHDFWALLRTTNWKKRVMIKKYLCLDALKHSMRLWQAQFFLFHFSTEGNILAAAQSKYLKNVHQVPSLLKTQTLRVHSVNLNSETL